MQRYPISTDLLSELSIGPTTEPNIEATTEPAVESITEPTTESTILVETSTSETDVGAVGEVSVAGVKYNS